MIKYLTIQDAVSQIKYLIEAAIIKGGTNEKNNLIRSSIPIDLLHNTIKADLIKSGVNPSLIKPSYGNHNGEIAIAGYFKEKKQDISILPNNEKKRPETLKFDGILKDTRCNYGHSFIESILSINVRSQLSSVSKNFDTLYERTIAEALNLHLRCQKMVLGEFYMIPVFSYDDTLANQNKVGFKKNPNVHLHIEKYIKSFSAINNRVTISGEEYKYEKVCLLIVDFSKKVPKIYNTDSELRADHLLSNSSTASLNHMNYPSFITSLLNAHEFRFGPDRFK